MIRFSFKDFFWFCSGANRQILRQCPVLEGHKYVLTGAFVFFIGILAAFSGGYALYTDFQSPFIGLLFGLLWGVVIFNLYRLIVSRINKEASPVRQWMQAMPRFLLVLVLSVVIAKPLELRIFKPELDSILAERMEASFDLITKKINERIAGIETETESLFNIRERLYQEYRCECGGACGTGKVGRRTECERKEAQYRQANQKYQALKAENDPLIAAARLEALTLDKVKTVETLHGLVPRISAAQELPFLPSFFIALLVFMLGIAPVLFKALAQPGSYDDALRVLEETRLKINLENLLRQQQDQTDIGLSLQVHPMKPKIAREFLWLLINLVLAIPLTYLFIFYSEKYLLTAQIGLGYFCIFIGLVLLRIIILMIKNVLTMHGLA